MGQKGKLAGREAEAMRLRAEGLNTFRIACALDVYPNAIRKLFERIDNPKPRKSAERAARPTAEPGR